MGSRPQRRTAFEIWVMGPGFRQDDAECVAPLVSRTFAFSRHEPELCFAFRPLLSQRAQGKPGADRTRGPGATKSTGDRTTGVTGNSGSRPGGTPLPTHSRKGSGSPRSSPHPRFHNRRIRTPAAIASLPNAPWRRRGNRLRRADGRPGRPAPSRDIRRGPTCSWTLPAS